MVDLVDLISAISANLLTKYPTVNCQWSYNKMEKIRTHKNQILKFTVCRRCQLSSEFTATDLQTSRGLQMSSRRACKELHGFAAAIWWTGHNLAVCFVLSAKFGEWGYGVGLFFRAWDQPLAFNERNSWCVSIPRFWRISCFLELIFILFK